VIKRDIYLPVSELLKQFPVVSITGPRQSGKTTFLREQFPDFRYVNMENPENREFLGSDPKKFFELYDKYVIFDEAQRTPKLFSYIQTIVDDTRIMGQFILSGSQNFLLLQNISQSLAGRVALFKLLPFDFEELKANALLPENYEEIIFKGFYPAIYDRNLDPNRFYPNYINTYVERDVPDVLNIHDIAQFRLFIRLCAARVGQSLNLNSLSRECGISQPTAKKWLSILESSYLIFLLPPYFKNYNKVLTKSPKLYFYDTGLLCNLLGIKSKETLSIHRQKGNLFENLVVAEYHKRSYHVYSWDNFYYWRDSNGNEIDLIKPQEDKLALHEIKSSSTLLKKHTDALEKFGILIKKDLLSKTLVYTGEDEMKTRFDTNIKNWSNISNTSSN
jgi:uncharacterized protein